MRTGFPQIDPSFLPLVSSSFMKDQTGLCPHSIVHYNNRDPWPDLHPMTSTLAAPPPQADPLQRQIEKAFARCTYPGDHRLVYDTSGGHLECNQVAKVFRGKHWRDIPLETLRTQHSAIFFFTPEAYAYFLPAYLIAGALHYEDADAIPDTVVFSLTPPDDPDLYDAHRLRMQSFTPEQRNAIIAFLQFLKDHFEDDDPMNDIDRALASSFLCLE